MLQTIYMYYVTIRTAININYYVISVLFWFVAAISMLCMLLCYLLDCILNATIWPKVGKFTRVCFSVG